MAIKHEFWTAEHIKRFERLLAAQQDNVVAKSLRDRLSHIKSEQEKRRFIEVELIPLMRHDELAQLEDEQEIPMRLNLRDIIQSFLYAEHMIENHPRNIPDTPEEAAERQRLAKLFGQGKTASETIIEERGPR